MPLTEKGEKIHKAMVSQYGKEKGEKVFYASKNAGRITGVDDDEHIPLKEGKDKKTINANVNKLLEKGHNEEAAVGIAQRKAFGDDNQHMGFTKSQASDIEKIVNLCDSVSTRLDAFEKRRAMQKTPKVEPRDKDHMQPSNRHPKEPPKVRVTSG